LVAYANGSNVLTITILDTGSGNPPPVITSVQVFLNSSNLPVGTAYTHLEPGNQTTVSFLIAQNMLHVNVGKLYSFFLDAWDGASEGSGSLFTVVATQQAVTIPNSGADYLFYDFVIVIMAVVVSAVFVLVWHRKPKNLRSGD
jgi:hypothetical protein